MEFIKGKAAEAIDYAFRTLLVTCMALLIIEQARKGFVTNYVNINYIIVLVAALGVLSLSGERKVKQEKRENTAGYIALLAVTAFIIMRIKTAELGWLSWMMSSIIAILAGLISFLVFHEKEEAEAKPKKRTIAAIFAATAIAAFCLLSAFLGILEAVRTVLGLPYIFLLPGLAISFVFFEAGQMGRAERAALSAALSITTVPVVVFFQHLIGLKVDLANVLLAATAVIAIAGLILVLERKLGQPQHN